MTINATYIITESPASSPGALDGYAMLCSCGDRQTTSLSERHARMLGLDHLAWHRDNPDRPTQTVDLGAIVRELDELHAIAHPDAALITYSSDLGTIDPTTLFVDSLVQRGEPSRGAMVAAYYAHGPNANAYRSPASPAELSQLLADLAAHVAEQGGNAEAFLTGRPGWAAGSTIGTVR